MPAKTYEITGIGAVHIIKRRDNRSIRLGFDSKGSVRVSLPSWVPYQTGINFALDRIDWIDKHRPAPVSHFSSGDRIGKAHRIKLIADAKATSVQVRLKDTDILVKYPEHEPIDGSKVQAAAERGAKKALLLEAEHLLPQRLKSLAASHNFSFRSLSIKQLKTKWGSCNQHREITLNYYLMQLPWHLIDYVLIHELVHTEHLNHSEAFWERFDSSLVGAKKIRKELKAYKTSVIAT